MELPLVTAWAPYEGTIAESPLLALLVPKLVSPATARAFYALRWKFIYPFQRRLISDLTIGELLIVVPIISALIAMTCFSSHGLPQRIAHPTRSSLMDVKESGSPPTIALALAFATAAHNSVFTFLLGIPFERALRYHKLFSLLAIVLGAVHGGVAYYSDPEHKKHHKPKHGHTSSPTSNATPAAPDGRDANCISQYGPCMWQLPGTDEYLSGFFLTCARLTC